MNDYKKIKTGVVGIGAMGYNHARIYSQISNLVGVSDLDEGKGRKIAKEYNTKFFHDYKSLFKEIDAVSIAVPTSLHEKVAIDAFESQLNVLLEKPISDKLSSAKNIISSSKRAKKILMIGQMTTRTQCGRCILNILKTPMLVHYLLRQLCQERRGFYGI